jgi:hypothetical protein
MNFGRGLWHKNCGGNETGFLRSCCSICSNLVHQSLDLPIIDIII